jgi:hypothetical protein
MKNTFLKKITGLGMLLAFPVLFFGQGYYRVSAEFSVKETYGDSLSRLTIGTLYFDQANRQIIYDIRFPEKEMIVVGDSVVMELKADTVLINPSAPGIIDFSLFNLILKDELSDYGLDDSLYQKASVERQYDLIVTTWLPGERLKGLTGEVQIARKGKLLHAILFKNVAGELIGKQFFRKYDFSFGLPFPQEMVQILSPGEAESYKVTTFSHVRFNEPNDAGIYSFSLVK